VQKEKYYIIRIKKWLFENQLLHLYTESYLSLAGKEIYLNLYTNICLPLAGKYILRPCSGSKCSYCSKNRTLQKQALTVMISPLCTNGHDITLILLNVAINTINLTLYLQRHIPTYLSICIFIRILDFIQFLLVIFLS
jgi:hypothetical protein